MMEYLTGSSGFSIVLDGDKAYTEEELTSHNLPLELTRQEILDLAIIRYELSTNSFKKYMAVTIATNVSEQSVAAIKENQSELQGIDIVEDSVRKYIDDVSMGPILGYTGQASADELEELRKRIRIMQMMLLLVKLELKIIWKQHFRARMEKKLLL